MAELHFDVKFFWCIKIHLEREQFMVNYKDVTEEWLKKAKLNYQEVKNVTSVLKSGKKIYSK